MLIEILPEGMRSKFQPNPFSVKRTSSNSNTMSFNGVKERIAVVDSMDCRTRTYGICRIPGPLVAVGTISKITCRLF
jgi:hypothetical protein